MKVTNTINGQDGMQRGVDCVKIEINGGDQEFKIYEQGGELIVKKIESGQTDQKSRERMSIVPCFDNQIRIT